MLVVVVVTGFVLTFAANFYLDLSAASQAAKGRDWRIDDQCRPTISSRKYSLPIFTGSWLGGLGNDRIARFRLP